MIGGRDRHCPRCNAELCTYNPGVFCWPCTTPGYIWHWSELVGDWIAIQIGRPEKPFEPAPGDIVLGKCFTPEPRRRKVDNWDKWRRLEPVNA